MQILLLSAYDANSHQYWRKGLRQYCQSTWSNQSNITELVLPARFFNWRIRGNGLYWSIAKRSILEARYDVVLATSMVDLATLRGLVPHLCHIPNILYFHENQFAYPQSSNANKAQMQGRADAVAAMMVQLYSALAADRIVFNSEYNRTTFLTGVDDLLQQLPDCVPPGVVATLGEKAQVLPVPLNRAIETKCLTKGASRKPFTVVWNHRWEFDKGPDGLLHCLQALPENLPFTFHIIGQSFRRVPDAFAAIKRLLEARNWLGHWGYIEDVDTYLAVLKQSQCVLSTARHDFQGLSVLQAVQAGCVPVVPDRLAYRELFAKTFRYDESSEAMEEGQFAASVLVRLCEEAPYPPDIQHLEWATLGVEYQRLLEQLAFEI